MVDVADLDLLDLLPEQSGYVYSKGNTVLSVDLNGGLSRTRADVVNAASIVTCEWFLKSSEYDYFLLFYNFITKQGALPFRLGLILDIPEVIIHTCKFVPETLNVSPVGHAYRVSAQLEVESAPEERGLIYLLALRDPDGVGSMLNSLEQLTNEDLEQ